MDQVLEIEKKNEILQIEIEAGLVLISNSAKKKKWSKKSSSAFMRLLLADVNLAIEAHTRSSPL